MRILGALAVALFAAGIAIAVDKPEAKPDSKEKIITTKSGLKYVELKEGSGERAREGDTVAVHCTGWLKDGKQFYTTVGDQPLTVTIGKTRLIKGWTEGLQGIRAGGKRKLIIPSNLAYGEEGRPPAIPPNSDLTFEVELINIK